LWRAAGIQSVLCFVVAFIVYDHQPTHWQTSTTAIACGFLIAAVFYGLAVLNPVWFEGA
jgi:hypothetical protein